MPNNKSFVYFCQKKQIYDFIEALKRETGRYFVKKRVYDNVVIPFTIEKHIYL